MPSAAQTMVGADPDAIARVLQDAGYKAERTKDNTGDPLIRSASSGRNFLVGFYNCTDNRDCRTVQFYAGFRHKGVSLEKINDWNRDTRFARAYLDKERDPVLEMDINLDEGGVTRGNFADNLALWTSLVDKYVGHIGFK